MPLHLGRRVKAEADKRGISVAALAAKIGRTPPAIYDIFKKEDLNTDLLKMFAEIFEIPITAFFGEDLPKGYVVQQGNGNKNLINSQLYEQEHAALLLCQKEVEGLKRENELLREMNDILKGKR